MGYIDLHCDTVHRMRYGGLEGNLLHNNGHVDLSRLAQGNYDMQVFAAFVELTAVTDPLESCILLLDDLDEQMKEYAETVKKVMSQNDLKHPGLKALYSVEEGGVIGDDLKNLDMLHRRGVRAVTLTWNYPNTLGYPNAEFVHKDRGLSAFGKDVVEKMQDLGMAVDVSHLSDRGFWDVADMLKSPFLASHSNARAVHHHSRNLEDRQIRALAERGGVVGLNFCSWFVDGTEHTMVQSLVRHFDHIYQVGGEDVLALGSDFDGITNSMEINGCHEMEKLSDALAQAGYSAAIIEKAMSGNAMRVFSEVLK